MTDAPRISDAEIEAFAEQLTVKVRGPEQFRIEFVASVKQALSAFLLARLPVRAKVEETVIRRGKPVTIHYDEEWCGGFNACIDQVMKGRGG